MVLNLDSERFYIEGDLRISGLCRLKNCQVARRVHTRPQLMAAVLQVNTCFTLPTSTVSPSTSVSLPQFLYLRLSTSVSLPQSLYLSFSSVSVCVFETRASAVPSFSFSCTTCSLYVWAELSIVSRNLWTSTDHFPSWSLSSFSFSTDCKQQTSGQCELLTVSYTLKKKGKS